MQHTYHAAKRLHALVVATLELNAETQIKDITLKSLMSADISDAIPLVSIWYKLHVPSEVEPLHRYLYRLIEVRNGIVSGLSQFIDGRLYLTALEANNLPSVNLRTIFDFEQARTELSLLLGLLENLMHRINLKPSSSVKADKSTGNQQEIPPLDKTKGWITAPSERMKRHYGFEPEILRTSRSQAKYKAPDEKSGIDKGKRIWRVDPDDDKLIWYLETSIKVNRNKQSTVASRKKSKIT